MSIFTTRVASAYDVAAVSKLLAESSSLLFSPLIAQQLIASAPSVVLAELDGVSVGVASLGVHMSGVSFPDMLRLLNDMLDGIELLPGDTAFLTAFALAPSLPASEAVNAARSLLRALGSLSPAIGNLLIVAPAAAGIATHDVALLADPLTALGLVRAPVSYDRAVYMLRSLLPRCSVRDACVEDFDDLAPIFLENSEVTRERFGEFFIAEVIESADGMRRTLVATDSETNKAVGFMATSAAVPTQLLSETFDLSEFGELGRPSLAAAAATARASARRVRDRSDWLCILRAHAEELAGIYDAALTVGTAPRKVMDGWTPEENEIIVRAVAESNGGADGVAWEALANQLPGRFAESIRDHYQSMARDGNESPAYETAGDGVAPPEGSDAEAAASEWIRATGAGSDQTFVPALAAELDIIGDAWGFHGPRGARLGQTLCVDAGIESGDAAAVPISRIGFARAVAHVQGVRAAYARRARAASWYAAKTFGVNAAASRAALGYGIVANVFGSLAAAVEVARKEAFRQAQVANTAAGKDVEAAKDNEKSTCDAAAKEAWERERERLIAAAVAAGVKDKAKLAPAKPAILPVPNSAAVVAAREARAAAEKSAERASAAQLAANAVLSTTVRVDIQKIEQALSAALPRGAELQLGEEFMRDLAGFLKVAQGAGGGVSEEELRNALDAWGKAELGRAAMPLVYVTAADGDPQLLAVPADNVVEVSPSAGEAAVASSVAALLGRNGDGESSAPHFHLPTLLREISSAYQSATKTLADAVAREEIEREKAKAAAAELAAGKAPPEAPKPKKGVVVVDVPPPITAAAASARLSLLEDPLIDPCTAIAAYLCAGFVDTSRGIVLTGLPTHDTEACARLTAALAARGIALAMHFHGEMSSKGLGPKPPQLNTVVARVDALLQVRDAVEERMLAFSLLDKDSLADEEIDDASSSPSAFAVSLYGVSPSNESAVELLLNAAFDAHPNLSYAVLTQPHMTPWMPLLNYFTQVKPRMGVITDKVLYVSKRASSPTAVSVRRATSHDREAIFRLVEFETLASGFMEAVIAAEQITNHIVDRANIVCFVATCGEDIVGAVVLSSIGADPKSLAALGTSFYVSDVADMSDHESPSSTGVASLLYAHLRPSNATAALTMLRQAASLFGRTALLFRLPAGGPLPAVVRSTCRPVRPRMLRDLSPSAEIAAAEAAAAKETPAPRGRVAIAGDTVAGLTADTLSNPRVFAFSLFVFSLGFGPIIERNERVVIYGASDAALVAVSRFAALEKGERFPHLTIVGERRGTTDFDIPSALSPYDISRLSISCAQHIPGTLMHISRPDHVITLSTGTKLQFERLLLLPDLEEPTSTALGFVNSASLPDSVFVMGSNSESLSDRIADLAESIAAAVASEQEAPRIVVYGNSLGAVAFLATMLDRGIPPSAVVLVRPPQTNGIPAATLVEALAAAAVEGESLAEDALAHELIPALLPPVGAALSPSSLFPALAVDAVLRNSGVLCMVGAKLEGLRSLGDDVEIELTAEADSKVLQEDTWNEASQVLSSSREPVTMTARLLVLADEATVPHDFFTAVNDCGLVYDFRVVVDSAFRTSDPAIFAGGACAKFSRRYGMQQPLMSENDPLEVGAALAAAALGDADAPPPEHLPELIRPVIIRAPLPGFNLVVARLGGVIVGKEVVTKVLASGGGVRFTRVVIDRYGTVSELLYLGSDPVAARNLGSLVGLHVSFLNSLMQRADAAPDSNLGIPGKDLTVFFSEPWAEALTSEAFPSLALALRAALHDDAAIEAIFEQLSAMITPTNDPEVDAVLDNAREQTVATALGATGDKLPAETRGIVINLLQEFLRIMTQTGVLSAYDV